jgi:hypothetical protein
LLPEIVRREEKEVESIPGRGEELSGIVDSPQVHGIPPDYQLLGLVRSTGEEY